MLSGSLSSSATAQIFLCLLVSSSRVLVCCAVASTVTPLSVKAIESSLPIPLLQPVMSVKEPLAVMVKGTMSPNKLQCWG